MDYKGKVILLEFLKKELLMKDKGNPENIFEFPIGLQ